MMDDIQSLRSSENGLKDDDRSIYSKSSKNYNPFYPRAGSSTSDLHKLVNPALANKLSMAELHQKQQAERQKLQEHKEKLMDEWGFKNEETKRMFEARFAKKN